MSESQRLGAAADLCCELQYGISALNAVHSAMVEGHTSPASFTGGLYCVYDYLSDKVNALSRLLDDGEDEAGEP